MSSLTLDQIPQFIEHSNEQSISVVILPVTNARYVHLIENKSNRKRFNRYSDYDYQQRQNCDCFKIKIVSLSYNILPLPQGNSTCKTYHLRKLLFPDMT